MTTSTPRVDVDLTLEDGDAAAPRRDPRTEICNLISSDDEPTPPSRSGSARRQARQPNGRPAPREPPVSGVAAEPQDTPHVRSNSSSKRGGRNSRTPVQPQGDHTSASVSSHSRMSDSLTHRTRAPPSPHIAAQSPSTQTPTVDEVRASQRYPFDAGRKLSLWDDLRKVKPGFFLASNIPLHNNILDRPTRSDDEDDADSALNKAIEQVSRDLDTTRNQNAPQSRPLSRPSNPPGRPPKATKRINKGKRVAPTFQKPPPSEAPPAALHESIRDNTELTTTRPQEDFQDAASAQLLASVNQQPNTEAPAPPIHAIEQVPQTNMSFEVNGTNVANDSPDRPQKSPTPPKRPGIGLEDTGDNLPRVSFERSVSPGIVHEDEPIAQFRIDENEAQSGPSRPFPLITKEIQGHLTQCIEIMREAQSDLVKPSLQMARLQSEKCWEPIEQAYDPWAHVNPVFPPTLQSVPLDKPNSEALGFESNVYGTGYTPREKITITVPAVGFKSTAPTLPKYKSIVRLGPNMLAENDRTLKYLPYFPDEEGVDGDDSKTELRLELEQRFHSRVDKLSDYQGCVGKADLYREATKKFLQDVGSSFNDILYYLHFDDKKAEEWEPPQLDSDEAVAALTESCHVRCPFCDQGYGGGKWEKVFPRLRPPSDRELGLAAMVYFAFQEIVGLSIWHVAVTDPEITSIVQSTQQERIAEVEAAGLRCSLCGAHDCPTHGAYLEHEGGISDSNSEDDESSDSDNELGHNFRQRLTKPMPQHKDPARQHLCGPYCVDPSIRLCDLMGSHQDGTVAGHYNKSQEASGSSGLEDDEICDTNCFWQVEQRMCEGEKITIECNNASLRHQRFWNWDINNIDLYQKLLPVYVKHRRGPCLMAMSIPQTCMQIFTEMLYDMYSVGHTAADDPGITVQPKAHHERNGLWWQEHSITHVHDERVPFQPCSHEGPCDGNPNCSCWSGKVACEYLCGCPKDCMRRYRGCKCSAKGRPCSAEDKCDCMMLNRECDPWLCHDCGVVEVLDPVNRYDDTILKDRCRNANIQRNRPKRTLKGISEVHGWGLFAGEEIRSHEFIGEYKGEVINREEADRRGAVYHYRGLEYLFSLNKYQEVDSSRAGNKMRFINNQNELKNQNCYSRKMLCNGVQRIGLYARGPKTIEPGTELFFCYGYPTSVTRYFWERGEKPKKGVAVPVAKTRRPYGSGKVRAIKEKIKPSISTGKKGKGGRPRNIRPPSPEEEIAYGEEIAYKGKGKAAADDIEGDSETAMSQYRRLSNRRKRKRVLVDGADDDDESGGDVFGGPRGSSPQEVGGRPFGLRGRIQSPPTYIDRGEVPESEDEGYDEQQGSKNGGSGEQEEEGDVSEEEDTEEEDEDSDAEGPSWGKTSRSSRTGDTRYGGAVQRRGWITRRKNMEKKQAQGIPTVDHRRRGGKRS